MLSKRSLPENLLQSTKLDYADKQLGYWTYDVDARTKYMCHVFILTCEDSNILNRYWEDLTENIAINFQINLEQEIQRWNIYLLFLLNEEVSKEIKYKIEQDKYCCRKLVEDNLKTLEFSDEFTANLVQEKIFSVYSIPSQLEVDSAIDKNIESIIKDCDPQILKALEGYQSNKQIGTYYSTFKSAKP